MGTANSEQRLLDLLANQAGTISELTEQVAALTVQNAELTARVAELLARLGVDSSNSSKPPSQDGPGAKPRSLRSKTGRKPGGQTGHRGATLQMVADPDRVVEHRPSQCSGCGNNLPDRLPGVVVEARQVFDLPPLDIEVTEHQLIEVECRRCGSATKARGPVEASRQVQYGPNLKAHCVNLVARHNMPLEQVAEYMKGTFGQPISPATINTMVTTAAGIIIEMFKPVATEILLSGRYAHADETGFKVAGKTEWAHSFSNPQATWIEVHDKRGSAATDEIGILPKYRGILICDAWGAYNKYPLLAGRQLCNAHLLRELNAVMDTHNHDQGQWCWAQQISDAITTVIANPQTVGQQMHLIISALAATASDTNNQAGKLGQKAEALQRRIRNRLGDYLRFATEDLPATNNPAEQEIRMVKLKQKIAGSMRTMTGANNFAAIRAYLSTARKHGTQALTALASAFSNEMWLPATP
jgi:transposase